MRTKVHLRLFVPSVVAMAVLLSMVWAGDASAAAPNFALYTRAHPDAWSRIEPYVRPADLAWGPLRVAVPAGQRGLTVTDYADLVDTPADQLANYSAVNLDGEYKNFAQGRAEAPKIRAWIDDYNRRHPNRPLRFIGYYLPNFLETHPDVVGYLDVLMVGYSGWQGPTIVEKARPWVNLARSKGATPAILLGSYRNDHERNQTVYLSTAEVLTNFHAVIDPAPAGLGVSSVGFYYDKAKADTLVAALRVLRG